MGKRREARERAVQFLFQNDLNPPQDLEAPLERDLFARFTFELLRKWLEKLAANLQIIREDRLAIIDAQIANPE